MTERFEWETNTGRSNERLRVLPCTKAQSKEINKKRHLPFTGCLFGQVVTRALYHLKRSITFSQSND